jgi:hypothetical protein
MCQTTAPLLLGLDYLKRDKPSHVLPRLPQAPGEPLR